MRRHLSATLRDPKCAQSAPSKKSAPRFTTDSRQPTGLPTHYGEPVRADLRPVVGLELELASQRDVRQTTPHRSSGHPRGEADGSLRPSDPGALNPGALAAHPMGDVGAASQNDRGTAVAQVGPPPRGSSQELSCVKPGVGRYAPPRLRAILKRSSHAGVMSPPCSVLDEARRGVNLRKERADVLPVLIDGPVRRRAASEAVPVVRAR